MRYKLCSFVHVNPTSYVYTLCLTGDILADVIRDYCQKLDIDNGLTQLGYNTSDIPGLVEATIPQERVTKLAPKEKTREDLAHILEGSMTLY